MAVTKYETIEITRCTIGDILEHVGESFLQCHKSFVINVDWIEIVDKTNMLINSNMIGVRFRTAPGTEIR